MFNSSRSSINQQLFKKMAKGTSQAEATSSSKKIKPLAIVELLESVSQAVS